MADLTPLERVRAYYRDLNTGDPEKVARHFHPDANHFYTRLGPHRSAQAIGEMTEQGVKHLDASWHLEHAIEQGDEVVIEWTMLWRDPRHGNARRIDRGTEWFRRRGRPDRRGARVPPLRPKNPQGNLLGFDHEGRGHTTLDAVGRGAGARRRRAGRRGPGEADLRMTANHLEQLKLALLGDGLGSPDNDAEERPTNPWRRWRSCHARPPKAPGGKGLARERAHDGRQEEARQRPGVRRAGAAGRRSGRSRSRRGYGEVAPPCSCGAVLKAHSVTDRVVHAADSFEGLPPPDEDKFPADTKAAVCTSGNSSPSRSRR